MKFGVAITLLVLASGSTNAKEELLRRRDVGSTLARILSESNADERSDPFFIKPDWGEERSHDTKGPKSPKGPKVTKGPKSPKSPKSPKGPSRPHAPTYSPPYAPPVRPPYSPPYVPPVQPPYSSPTKCPEIDYETHCTVGGPDTCAIHSSCQNACVPRFCKLPSHPHKIRDGPPKDDMYVKLGNLCGRMVYNEGQSVKSRHDIEVCCEVDDLPRFDMDEDFECVACGACKSPQLVNDACCKVAFGIDGDDGRAGENIPECEYGCCKCGPGDGPLSYACLPSEDSVCGVSLCPDSLTGTTAVGDTTTTQGVGSSETTTTEATTGTTTSSSTTQEVSAPVTTSVGETTTTQGVGSSETTTTEATTGTTTSSSTTQKVSAPVTTTTDIGPEDTTSTTQAGPVTTTTGFGTVPEVTTTTRQGDFPPITTTPVTTTTTTTTTTQATQVTTTQVVPPTTTTAQATTTTLSVTTEPPPQVTTTQGSGPQLGLQPSCNVNDETRFNICIDLTSTTGQFEANWMQDVLAAARSWEQTIIGDLPSATRTGTPTPPDLSRACTNYPDPIDDLIICAQDVVITSGAVAFAGPYIRRPVLDDDGNQVFKEDGDPLTGLPIASRIGMNRADIEDEGLDRIMLHEIAHALGFPFVNEDFGFRRGDFYRSNSDAGTQWDALCGTDAGDIPMQAGGGGHWDENCLGEELMTPTRVVTLGIPVPSDGFAPLSAMTIGAMQDIGYEVTYANAEPFTLSDLGTCPPGACPAKDEEAAAAAGSIVVDVGRPVLAESEKIACMNDFKDDLIYFHEQLEKTGYDGVGVERIDALIADEGGHLHTFSFTYEDVMNM